MASTPAHTPCHSPSALGAPHILFASALLFLPRESTGAQRDHQGLDSVSAVPRRSGPGLLAAPKLDRDTRTYKKKPKPEPQPEQPPADRKPAPPPPSQQAPQPPSR